MTDALWSSDDGVYKLWFDRVGKGSTILGAIVTALCGRVGLQPADLSTSELDQEVQGYMVPRPVAVREALEKLSQAYLFDVVESDWALAFRKRERDPVLTIGDESLAAHEAGSQRPPKLHETRTQEAELPRRVTVRYIAYPASDQTTDFGAPQSAIEVTVYQISEAVGRGFAARGAYERHTEPRRPAHPTGPGPERSHRQRGIRPPRRGVERSRRDRRLGRQRHGHARGLPLQRPNAPDRHASRCARSHHTESMRTYFR